MQYDSINDDSMVFRKQLYFGILNPVFRWIKNNLNKFDKITEISIFSTESVKIS